MAAGVSSSDEVFKLPCTLWVLIMCSTIGGGLFGYDTGVVSGALIMIEDNWDLDEFDEELVVSATVFAAAIGSLASGYPIQIYGRKPMIMISATAYILGACIVALAKNFKILVVGRIVLGLAMGIASMGVPIYLAEVSPSQYRGYIVALNSIMIVVGQLLACVVNISVESLPSSINWRISMGCAAIPATIQFVGFLCLPESPRYLVEMERYDDAKEVLRSVRGVPSGGDDTEVRAELAEIQQHHEESKTDETWLELWANPPIRRAFLLGIGIMVLQQVAGINIVMYYGAVILEDAGFSSDDSIELTALLASAQLLGLLIGLQIIDHAGRRTMILTSGCCVTFFLLVIGLSYYDISSLRLIALFAVVFYLVTFGAGMSAGAWVVCSEVFPSHARGLGNAQAVAANWITDGIISISFLSLSSAIGTDNVFLVMAVCTVIGLVWLNQALPETRGKTLEEITAVFEKLSNEGSGAAASSESVPLLTGVDGTPTQ